MASFASSATTCGTRKHAWTNYFNERTHQTCKGRRLQVGTKTPRTPNRHFKCHLTLVSPNLSYHISTNLSSSPVTDVGLQAGTAVQGGVVALNVLGPANTYINSTNTHTSTH